MEILNQTRVEFLTESVVESINNIWKVNHIESNSILDTFPKAFIQTGKRYYKIMVCEVKTSDEDYCGRNHGRVFMFVDKETGAVYKPASLKAPAKGIRFYIESLSENPEICDQFGSFLYRR